MSPQRSPASRALVVGVVGAVILVINLANLTSDDEGAWLLLNWLGVACGVLMILVALDTYMSSKIREG
ncbi:MAG: hypothetical protein IPM45_00335 [Acidimicrobiales bacterium]|nr:hypothetical protein [Acidimicrobiales bacterium]